MIDEEVMAEAIRLAKIGILEEIILSAGSSTGQMRHLSYKLKALKDNS